MGASVHCRCEEIYTAKTFRYTNTDQLCNFIPFPVPTPTHEHAFIMRRKTVTGIYQKKRVSSEEPRISGCPGGPRTKMNKAIAFLKSRLSEEIDKE